MRKTVRALTASVLCLLAAVLASCGNSAEVSVADTKPADNRPVTVGCEFAARAKDTSVTRDDVTVEPIAYQEEDKYWYLYLLITNKSGEMLHLSGDVVFYDPKGKQIDKAYSNAIAVEDGTTVYLDFTSNGQYSSFEYKIEEFVPVEDFQPIDKELERLEDIAAFVNEQMEEPHRSIFHLRFDEDLTIAEIARRLGLNPNTTYKYLAQCMEHIRQHFNIH